MFFRMRQSWPDGQAILLGQLGLHFDLPASHDPLEAYKDLTYLSQTVHAHCLSLSSSHFRLQRGASAATMGLMFWSLNNQWQGQSDAAIDYTGRWKLLQFETQRFYAPILLHVHQGWDHDQNSGWNSSNITLGIANDTPHTGSTTVNMTLRSWASGAPLRSWVATGQLPAYSSYNFSKWRRTDLLAQYSTSAVFLTASATIAGAGAPRVARVHHFFDKLKHVELADPQIELAFSGLVATCVRLHRFHPC